MVMEEDQLPVIQLLSIIIHVVILDQDPLFIVQDQFLVKHLIFLDHQSHRLIVEAAEVVFLCIP